MNERASARVGVPVEGGNLHNNNKNRAQIARAKIMPTGDCCPSPLVAPSSSHIPHQKAPGCLVLALALACALRTCNGVVAPPFTVALSPGRLYSKVQA